MSFTHIARSTNKMFIALTFVLGGVGARVQKKRNLLKREGQRETLAFCIENMPVLVIKCLSS